MGALAGLLDWPAAIWYNRIKEKSLTALERLRHGQPNAAADRYMVAVLAGRVK